MEVGLDTGFQSKTLNNRRDLMGVSRAGNVIEAALPFTTRAQWYLFVSQGRASSSNKLNCVSILLYSVAVSSAADNLEAAVPARRAH